MVPREGHPHLWSRVRAPPHAILTLDLDSVSNDSAGFFGAHLGTLSSEFYINAIRSESILLLAGSSPTRTTYSLLAW